MPMEIQRRLRRKHKVTTDGRVLCRAVCHGGGRIRKRRLKRVDAPHSKARQLKLSDATFFWMGLKREPSRKSSGCPS